MEEETTAATTVQSAAGDAEEEEEDQSIMTGRLLDKEAEESDNLSIVATALTDSMMRNVFDSEEGYGRQTTEQGPDGAAIDAQHSAHVQSANPIPRKGGKVIMLRDFTCDETGTAQSSICLLINGNVGGMYGLPYESGSAETDMNAASEISIRIKDTSGHEKSLVFPVSGNHSEDTRYPDTFHSGSHPGSPQSQYTSG